MGFEFWIGMVVGLLVPVSSMRQIVMNAWYWWKENHKPGDEVLRSRYWQR